MKCFIYFLNIKHLYTDLKTKPSWNDEKCNISSNRCSFKCHFHPIKNTRVYLRLWDWWRISKGTTADEREMSSMLLIQWNPAKLNDLRIPSKLNAPIHSLCSFNIFHTLFNIRLSDSFPNKVWIYCLKWKKKNTLICSSLWAWALKIYFWKEKRWWWGGIWKCANERQDNKLYLSGGWDHRWGFLSPDSRLNEDKERKCGVGVEGVSCR